MANFFDDLLNKARNEMVGVTRNVTGFLGSLQAPPQQRPPQMNPVQQMFNQVGNAALRTINPILPEAIQAGKTVSQNVKYFAPQAARNLSQAFQNPQLAQPNFDLLRKKTPQNTGTGLLSNILNAGQRYATNTVANAGEAVIGAPKMLSEAAQMYAQNRYNPIAYAKAGMAAAKVNAPTTPLFQGMTALQSVGNQFKFDPAERLATGILRGQADANINPNLPKSGIDLPVVGNVDPLLIAGQMYGFTKNPAWERIFGKTKAINNLTSENVMNVANNTLNPTAKAFLTQFSKVIANPKLQYLITRGTKGSLEGLIQGMGRITLDMTPQQVAQTLGAETAMGAGSEIVMDKLTEKAFEAFKKAAVTISRKLPLNLDQIQNVTEGTERPLLYEFSKATNDAQKTVILDQMKQQGGYDDYLRTLSTEIGKPTTLSPEMQARVDALKANGGRVPVEKDLDLQGLQQQAQQTNPIKPQPKMGIDKNILEQRKQAILQGQGTDVSEMPVSDQKWQPDWVKAEKDRVASLLASEPPPTKQVLMPHEEMLPQVQKPKLSIQDDLKSFTEYPLKDTVYGDTAEKAAKDLLDHGDRLIDRIVKGMEYYKLTNEQMARFADGKETPPPELEPLISAYRSFTDAIRTNSEAPMGEIETYLPHITDTQLNLPQELKNIGNDLKFGTSTMELGTTKKRTGVLTEYSSDIEKLLKERVRQMVYQKYGDRINATTPEVARMLTNVQTHLKSDVDGVMSKPSNEFDYIKESGDAQPEVQKTKVITKISPLDTWDSFTRKLSKETGMQKLADVMTSIRDMNDTIQGVYTKFGKMSVSDQIKYLAENLEYVKSRPKIIEGLNKVTQNGKLEIDRSVISNLLRSERNLRVQNLIDEIGKYTFDADANKPSETTKYLNTVIDGLMKRNKYSQTLLDKAANAITGTFYRAQVWGNINTAVVQLTEAIRIPVMYGKEGISAAARGLKEEVTGKRDILRDYDFASMETDISKELGGFKKQQGLLAKLDEKVGKVGNFMVAAAENNKNKAFLYAAEDQGKRLGLQGADLKRFVRSELFANGWIIHEFNTPKMLKNPLVRMALQYQQYNAKLINRALELWNQGDKGKVVGLIGSQAFGALLLAVITGKGIQSVSDKIFGVSAGPAISLPIQIGQMMQSIYEAKQAEEESGVSSKSTMDYYKGKLGTLAFRNTVPFANQGLKTYQAAEILRRRYEKSEFTDPTGKKVEGVKYLAPDNAFDQGRGLLFGKSSFPQYNEFYKTNDVGNMFNNIGKTATEQKQTQSPAIWGKKAEEIQSLLSQGDKAGAQQILEGGRNAKANEVSSLNKLDTVKQNAYEQYKKLDNSYDSQVIKDSILIKFPELRNILREKAYIANNGDLSKINPVFITSDQNYVDYLKYQQLQDTANGSIEAKQFLANRPQLKTLMAQRSVYYKNNPIENFGTENANPVPPVATNRVQQLLNMASTNKSVYNDPEVAQFLDATLKYRNEVRGLQGLEPMDKYRNIAGSKNYGVEFGAGGGGSKKMYLTKSYPKKMKVYKPKKLSLKGLKMPKVKLVSKPGKLPKIKAVKLKKSKVALT